jgi:acetaldehyde dehydrogenase/alcohol dehydrogenase
VITDKKNGNIKYPLADYAIQPNVAIIDSQFTIDLPQTQTADTGLDVLTHAIEAYVSTMASDFTDGLALQAIAMVFEFLPRAYNNGREDILAREKMHNASCIAGMAFTNASLGINHSMAHKLGGEYGISHGRSNAIFLPYIIEYNAQKPTKFAVFPKYENFIADEKYAKIAAAIGRAGKNKEESIKNLIEAVKKLKQEVNIPASISATGVDESKFFANLQKLSENAHEDQCTGTNPRYPLIDEIKELFKRAYYGD